MATNQATPQQPGNPPPISSPVMGLYLDRPSHTIDPKGLEACNNIRIEYGRYRSDLMGWSAYNGGVNLDGQTVKLIDTFQMSVGPQQLIYANPTDLFLDVAGGAPVYITPTYSTGTVKVWRYSQAAVSSVDTAGSNYVVGDVLTSSGGTAGLQATALVTTVSAGGHVTGAILLNPGYYSTLPSNPVTMTGGSGTLCKLDFTAGVSAVAGVGSFWATPIGGNATALASAPTTGGPGDVNSFTLDVKVLPDSVQIGQLIGDSSNAAALQVPTIITGISGTSLTLSKPIAFQVQEDDTIVIGGQLANFRKNVRPGDKFYFGAVGQNSQSATWWTVATVQSNTQFTLTADYGSTTSTGNTYTVRQLATPISAAAAPFSAFNPNWSSETFPNAGFPYNKDMWFATNGVDPLISWDGLAVSGQYVTTVPFISSQIHRHKNLMIYGGLVGSNGQLLPSSIANSDNGTPTLVAGGVAFQGSVSDGPYVINHLATLGNILMIYMSGPQGGASDNVSAQGGSVVSGAFVGYPNVWAFSEVIRGRGPIAQGLVAEFPDRHQFLASDGMYRYNGIFVQIMNDHIWRPVLKNVDMSRASQAFCCINETYGDLQWVLPLQTDGATLGVNFPLSAATAYTEAYMEQPNSFLFKPYTQRDFPFTAAGLWQGQTGWTWNNDGLAWSNTPFPFDNTGLPTTVPIQLVGDSAGNIWQLYQSNGFQGVNAYTSWLWYPQRVLDLHSRMLVKRVYPFFEYVPNANYTISVTLSLRDGLQEPTVITDTQQFDPSYSATTDGTVFRYTKHFRRGRVAQVCIGTRGCTGYEPFIIDGYDLDYIPGGLR